MQSLRAHGLLVGAGHAFAVEVVYRDQDDRDVVVTTIAVGQVDEGPGGAVEIGETFVDRAPHFFVAYRLAQPVRAQDVDVSGARVIGGDVDDHRLLHSEGSGDDVPRQPGHLLVRQMRHGDAIVVDEGVVPGELLELGAPESVAAAIAHVPHEDPSDGLGEDASHHRGLHTSDLGIAGRSLENSTVCQLDTGDQSVLLVGAFGVEVEGPGGVFPLGVIEEL